MITQYAAASIASENKVLVHPASADSIPTCENTEDHVSMGTIAARQAIQIIDNVEEILSIAVLTGFYAIKGRMQQFKQVGFNHSLEALLAPATFDFYQSIQQTHPHFQQESVTEIDRFLAPELRAITKHMDVYLEVAERYF